MERAFQAMTEMAAAMTQQSAAATQQFNAMAQQTLTAEHCEITWEVFHRRFLDKYFPDTARAEKEQEFLRLQQGSMTVLEYAAKFESLARYFSPFRDQANQGWLSERFQEGLMFDIQKSELSLRIRNLQELIDRCVEVEGVRNHEKKSGTGRPVRP